MGKATVRRQESYFLTSGQVWFTQQTSYKYVETGYRKRAGIPESQRHRGAAVGLPRVQLVALRRPDRGPELPRGPQRPPPRRGSETAAAAVTEPCRRGPASLCRVSRCSMCHVWSIRRGESGRASGPRPPQTGREKGACFRKDHRVS